MVKNLLINIICLGLCVGLLVYAYEAGLHGDSRDSTVHAFKDAIVLLPVFFVLTVINAIKLIQKVMAKKDK